MTENTDRHWNRAQRYLSEGNLDAARVSLESVLSRNPAHVEAHLCLSDVAWQDDRVRDSARHAHDAVRLMHDDPELIVAVAAALLRAGEVVGARDCLAHPALSVTRSVPALLRAAGLRYALHENHAALDLYDRAQAAGVDGAEFHFQRAMQLAFTGRLAAAESELTLSLRQNPAFGRAALELSRLRTQSAQANHLQALTDRLAQVQPGSFDHAAVEFARYKELEDLGRYDEAWVALAHGNALMYGRQRHDPAYLQGLIERLLSICTADFVRSSATAVDSVQPIFIIGMPRSGTTLFDRVLGNHSRIASAGELDDFALQLRLSADHRTTLDATMIERLPALDYTEIGARYLAQTRWRAQGKPFFTDKLPHNWMLTGLIARALPQARFLHLVREPMAVCFSNYRALFADAFPHIYDLNALASHYCVYRHTMQHWHRILPGRILDVSYDQLAREPERTARKALAFLGLDWEPGCTDVARNRTAVSTLSLAQVREPIHTRFVDAWRRYELQLAPLARALAA